MGCKDDNTCDQPATKGEIESLMAWGVFGLGALAILLMRDTKREMRAVRVAMNDPHAIRELLDESPATRKALIRYEKARQWDRIMEEEKEWLEQQEWYEGTNPYRD